MKSVILKSNDEKTIDYLLKQLQENEFEETIYFTKKEFKIYKNIIIHYKGKGNANFCNYISNILTKLVIEINEKQIIKKLINANYFYFEPIEKNEIMKIATEELKQNDEYEQRKEKIQFAFFRYLTENKSIIIEGFINFRIKEYMQILDMAIDFSVNKYIVEREYTELISLLKLYITSSKPNIDFVHLIYCNKQSIMIDKEMKIIDIQTDIYNAKYLSDISFSTNDYALNTILNLLPEKICIHLIDEEDEFINTIKLIFDNRVEICKDCSICKTYKMFGKFG